MSHTPLDELLERSVPRVDAAPGTDLAATVLAAAALHQSRKRTRTSHVMAAVAALVGAATLTAGAAVAIPLLTDWRQWEARNDIVTIASAGVLGLSESTARGRYQRARTRLASDPSIRDLKPSGR